MTDHLSEFETLHVERRGFALYVTFNRPERRNALSAQMWGEIAATLDMVHDDRTVRAIVLRGAGGNFSAGGDLKERDAIRDETPTVEALTNRNATGGTVLRRIDIAPQVIISIVEGNALGGGVGLACASDIVIAHESAIFRLPELGLGIPPAQIAPYVVRRIGVVRARRLALTTATVRAPEAVSLGLADFRCETNDEIDALLAEMLKGVGRCGPEAIGRTKSLLQEASRGVDDRYIGKAGGAFAEAYLSAEGQEGAAAVREGRKAWWQEDII